MLSQYGEHTSKNTQNIIAVFARWGNAKSKEAMKNHFATAYKRIPFLYPGL
jgi:hypothetical protein